MLSSFIDLARVIGDIKKQEIPLPIIKKTVNVSPLLVGDDLSLRTSLSSPATYDKQLIKLLYNHTEMEDDPKIDLARFSATTSHIDKSCLLWALYKVTYETLSKREVTCPKDNCGESKDEKTSFEVEIAVDDLIHEDTFQHWDEELPFYEYLYIIEVPYEGYNYIFHTRLPSISNNNQVISRLSTTIIQRNMEKTGELFTKPEQMTLLTNTIEIKKDDGTISEKSSNLDEIIIAFQRYIPSIVSESFFDKYGKRFNKYVPKFYAKLKCPSCGGEFDHTINLEIEFFRRSLLNQTSSSE